MAQRNLLPESEVCVRSRPMGSKVVVLRLTCVLVTVIALAFVIQAFGQSATPQNLATGPSVVNNQSGAPADNAQILQELEKMRARIQELEAKLKAQSETAAKSEPGSSAPMAFSSAPATTQVAEP